MATRKEMIRAANMAAVARNRAAGGTNWNQTGAAPVRQYATSTPSASAIWDQSSAGWIDPNAAPGQHFTASAYQAPAGSDQSGAVFGAHQSPLAQMQAPQVQAKAAQTQMRPQAQMQPQTPIGISGMRPSLMSWLNSGAIPWGGNMPTMGGQSSGSPLSLLAQQLVNRNRG